MLKNLVEKTKYGWICSYCAKQPNVIFELEAENTLIILE
ncbi:hypothetical protein CPter91_3494 [Collimonas pratensis]|uniref:Uncharacterized protein n=1 Tax=Collimonas pratensis TaxID=279113 RepID=A0A127Q6X4_9BURK|nr:hypothetical protein CPter91_3494 [Collimonas pratensis]